MKEQYSERRSSSRTMRVLLFSLAMLLAYVPMGFAQTLKVTGTVTDAAGRPLVGVNVVVKGTTIGTTTLTDGKYELNFPPPRLVN